MNFGAIVKSLSKLFGQAGKVAKKAGPIIGPAVPILTDILKNNQQPFVSKGPDVEALRNQSELDRKNAEELRQQNASLLGQLDAERKKSEQLAHQNTTLRGENNEFQRHISALQEQLKESHKKRSALEKNVRNLWLGVVGIALCATVLAVWLYVK